MTSQQFELQATAEAAAKPTTNHTRTLAWRRAAIGAIALTAGLAATLTRDAATWFGVRGPLCPLGACLGPDACPGCGLVRSTAATLQGHLSAAWHLHPAGPVIAGLLVAGLLLDLHILRRGNESALAVRLRRAGRWTFLVAVCGGWLLRLAT